MLVLAFFGLDPLENGRRAGGRGPGHPRLGLLAHWRARMVPRQGRHVAAGSLPVALGVRGLGQPKECQVGVRPTRILDDELPEVACGLPRIDGKPPSEPQTELKIPATGVGTVGSHHSSSIARASSARPLLANRSTCLSERSWAGSQQGDARLISARSTTT